MIRIGMIACLVLILPGLQFAINTRREAIVPTKDVYLAITPGEFVGTMMLGGFRGIAVDLLWIRAQRLQQERRYFELVALGDLISRLQPHDRMIWEFTAWNRAYNVSIEFNEREDRWKWVKSGLDLNLQGIERLPGNWKLYKHLAFMFNHKCKDYREETLRDYGEDNFTLARRYYQMAIRLEPDVPLHVYRAVIHTYEEQGDFETALRLYEEHLQKFPFDQTARQNRDSFMHEKEEYAYFIAEIMASFAAGDYAQVTEVYEDNIRGKPYLMPQHAVDAVLRAYMESGDFDRGIRFIHRVMNVRMEDKNAVYALYAAYCEKYNAHYAARLKELGQNGRFEEQIALYKQKYDEKKVDISLESGIMVLDALIKTGRTEDARSLLADLQRLYGGQDLVRFEPQLNGLDNSTH